VSAVTPVGGVHEYEIFGLRKSTTHQPLEVPNAWKSLDDPPRFDPVCEHAEAFDPLALAEVTAYKNVSAEEVADVEVAVVTVTSTEPAECAGEVAVI